VKRGSPDLILSTSPYVKRPVETPAIMRHVLYALVPVAGSAVYFFGLSALALIATCAAAAVLTEWALGGRRPLRESTVADGSAVVTGVLLALTLPPGLPLWMGFLGAVIAIVFGKVLFGGLGQNIFNPSLTGRAFLQACFPVALTTWAPYGNLSRFAELRGDTFALPFTRAHVDAVSAATPLAKMKFESIPTAVSDLFIGSVPGSLGETSAVLILVGGAYLAARKFLNWRIPVGIFATVFVLASLLHLINPERFPPGLFHVLSGGLMLGAVFMATDPVSSPVTPRGCWVFALGVGLLVVVIRQFGGLPEGVMYSILLMNAVTPIIDRYTQPRIYGAREPREET
jgi:electron transport complex protein RnfD